MSSIAALCVGIRAARLDAPLQICLIELKRYEIELSLGISGPPRTLRLCDGKIWRGRK